MKKKNRFLANKTFVVFSILAVCIILTAVFAPVVTRGVDPLKGSLVDALLPPCKEHIFGTDKMGRDIFSRVIYGARASLSATFGVVALIFLVGTVTGVLAGYFGGVIDAVIMRIADIFMSFPSIVLILVLVAVLGPSVWSVTCVIGVLGWTQFARLIYANVLSVSEKEYVESARAIGTSNFKIVTKYVLPNSFAPILIAITFQMASPILSESSLSFLGMGVQPPGASWGNMLYDAQSITVLSQKLWIWLPPGLALLITVLSINFLGDGIRDALDPKIKL